MKIVIILLLLFSFLFCDIDSTLARKDAMVKDAAKAEVMQNVYDSSLSNSQYINYQWSLLAKEKSQENIILRSICLGLIIGSISYIGAGQLCTILISSGIGYMSYNWINNEN